MSVMYAYGKKIIVPSGFKLELMINRWQLRRTKPPNPGMKRNMSIAASIIFNA
jgi:hypothetical protein